MQTTSPNIQTARIICLALMGGVVLFWGVAFALTAGDGLDADLPLDSTVLLAIVCVTALGAFGAALAFRSRAVAAVSSPGLRDNQAPAGDQASAFTNLITAWALLEGQAFMAGVLFMLTGNASLLVIPAIVFVIGFAMTFPKPEWFGQATGASRP